MDEVPCAQPSLFTLDEQHAFAGKDEKVLLLVFSVVKAVPLTRFEDVEPDAVLRELDVPALEAALRAGCDLRFFFGRALVLRRQPLCVTHVHDEPAVGRGRKA